MTKKVLLLDADSLIYICAVKETFQDCKDEFDNRLNTIIESTEATSYIGFITYPKCFRYSVSALYKANRKSSPAPKYLKALREYAVAEYGFIGYEGLEADDLVGIGKTFYDSLNIANVIGAIDKDVLNQIPGRHFNYSFNKDLDRMNGYVETTEEQALEFLFLQTIMGDSGDNIKGLAGYGPKKALDYLKATQAEEFTCYYTDCLKLYCLKLGNKLGTVALSETYRLVRILRTEEEAMQELHITRGESNPFLLFQGFELPASKEKVEW